MKKAFSLSITLWISMVLLSISAYVLYIAKKELNNDKYIIQKLNFYISTHNTLEKLKFYLGTGKYEYDYVKNNFLNFPKKVFIDNLEYKINNTYFKIQDEAGILNIRSINSDILARILRDKNITINPLALVDTYKDWIDTDDYVRPYGAEKTWYISHDFKYIPRNWKIFAKDEVYDIKNWINLFKKFSNLFTYQLETGYNYTSMNAKTLYYKYGIDKKVANDLQKIKHKDIKKFLRLFYSLNKNNFNYEEDTFFSSKILKIEVWKGNKDVKYRLVYIINFNTGEIQNISY